MYKHYINGALVQGTGARVKVLDPADNSVIEELDTASEEQCLAALEAAQAAFKGWAATPIGERARWLDKFIDAVMAEKEKIAELLAAETGKPYKTAMEDLYGFEDYARYFVHEAARIEGTTVYTPGKTYGELYHAVERRPLGVVVAHIAWNYPIAMAALKIGPAMVAGDPIVLKPASDTPLATLYLGEIAAKMDMPKGVLNFVSGPSGVVAKALNTSKIPSMITLIGSSDTGRRAMHEASASSIKRFSMELGGNAPVIVMPDADIDLAVRHCIAFKCDNAGQICTNYNRVYVHAAVYEEYLSKLEEGLKEVKCGSKHDEGYIMGPMITRTARDRILELIEEAKGQGAALVCGGTIPQGLEAGNFITPALLRDVTEDMRVSKEEIFGPIIAVRSFTDLEDVLEKANDTDLGLASYFFGHDARDIAKAFETLQTGDVYINGGGGGAHTPHIGMKQSGIGCDQSKWSLEEYFQLKRVSMIP